MIIVTKVLRKQFILVTDKTAFFAENILRSIIERDVIYVQDKTEKNRVFF